MSAAIVHGLGVAPAGVNDLVVLGAVAAPAQLLEEGDVPVVARLEREGHALGVAERRRVEVLSPKQRLAIPYNVMHDTHQIATQAK